jgi:DMSO/TMAO reductase YedYZ molybdopterin-dependent catalytic subunit
VLIPALCSPAEKAVWAATSSITTTVTVGGNGSQPLSLTVADLNGYAVHQIAYVPEATESKSGTAAARGYTGCILRDVLVAAKPVESTPHQLRRSYVVATASDGYEVVFSRDELFISPVGENVFIVYERDGAPLADDE